MRAGQALVILPEWWLSHVASTLILLIFQAINEMLKRGGNRVKLALRDENVRQWHEVEQDFLESEYRPVRDRQMKELESEDDLLNKVPVRFVSTNATFPRSDIEKKTRSLQESTCETVQGVV